MGKPLSAPKAFRAPVTTMARTLRPISLLKDHEALIALRSIIISPDRELGLKLTAVLAATGQVEVARMLDHYPTQVELIRTLRAMATEVVFIDFESLKQGLEIVH